ncbi:GntR family transcriptional regulator [Streptomyces sp. NPDC091287]|uniref:GntR family transcriptional regulator n=1 Tax=Streptomyces sp. NPDC091287 TaxID=3365988 RepID=UPI003801F03C
MTVRPVPLYRRIAESLRRDILDGYRRPGALLPSERELCRNHSAARATVRHGLQLLVGENLAVPVQGVGYVVSATHAKRPAPDPDEHAVRVPLALLNATIEVLEARDPRDAAPGAASRLAGLLRAAARTPQPLTPVR